jgi:hypothetical protein
MLNNALPLFPSALPVAGDASVISDRDGTSRKQQRSRPRRLDKSPKRRSVPFVTETVKETSHGHGRLSFDERARSHQGRSVTDVASSPEFEG